MYGMVNKAIKEYISTQYGDGAWREVKRRADIQDDNFISMDQYSDEVSVGMVVAAAAALEKSPAAFLEEVGEYWIAFALDSHYGDLLRDAGDTLPEILDNLDNLHVRVGYSFDNLKPPSFWCTDVTDKDLILHYVSERDGLAPMVNGLVKGLARMLNTTCEVEQIRTKGVEATEDQFRVTFNG